MKYIIFLCFLVFAGFSAKAQDKIFTYRDTQVRNDLQQWEKIADKALRTVSFSDDTIELQVSNEEYYLNIVSTTLLPNNGVIYLCKDQRLQDITVMLISNQKMYVYNDQKRYLINFSSRL